ncbi:MAG: XisH family protein [Anaerolineales bacterium]|nr:XisH family protein [Anaerolineales bacterium]
MPARDFYHDAIKTALIKEGWVITHDPLFLKYGSTEMYVDLGAESVFAAEKGTQKIAVEIKSFIGKSELADFQQALGQYLLYRGILEEVESDRILYLAIRDRVYLDVFESAVGRLISEKHHLKLIVFDWQEEEIVLWKE